MSFVKIQILASFLIIFSENEMLAQSINKISQSLQSDIISRTNFNSSNPLLTCLLYTNENELYRLLSNRKIISLSQHPLLHCNCVQLNSNLQLELLLSDTNILFLDKFYEKGNEEILIPGHNLSLGNIHYVHQNYPQLNGSEIVVSIKENLFDNSDVDLKNRIISNPKSSKIFSPHASIMATWIAGAGNASSSGKGIAKASKVISTSFNNLLPEENSFFITNKVSIQNHSYGSDIDNSYGIYSMAYDQSVNDNPNLVHIFSSGNSGTEISPNGQYSGINAYSNITGNSKMAKNIITVGAIGINDSVQEFSSRGPAYDGRIKPDLVAYGHDGTSSSAAIVSGACALIIQTYKDKTGILPGSELVKSILVCSADDKNSPGPDFISGFGKLNLKTAIDLINNHKIFVEQINSNEIKEFQFQIPSNIKLAKFVLSWIDPPGNVQSNKALINDLDFNLVDPNGIEFSPWLANHNPDSLSATAIRGIDTLNNIEMISIESPIQGNYVLRMKSKTLQNNLQKFSLTTFTEQVQKFLWTYPVKNSFIESNKLNSIHWTSNIDALSMLEWKPAGDSNWRIISLFTDLKNEKFNWSLPDTFCVGQLRMNVNNNYYLSDSFLISAIPKIKVDFSCKDSTLLYWNKSFTDAQYNVYGLGNLYLEKIFTTYDTSIVLDRVKYPYERFAISVFSKTFGIENSTDLAPNPNNVSTCYLQQFIANRIDISRSALLKLDLVSTYGIKRIAFEKLILHQWTTLFEKVLPQTSNSFFDNKTEKGSNTYRAIIEFTNGEEIITQVSIVWFPQQNGVLISPNPISSSGIITIINDNSFSDVSRIKIYNLQGKELIDEELIDIYSKFEIPSLPYGVYVIRIFSSSGKKIFSDKLLVIP